MRYARVHHCYCCISRSLDTSARVFFCDGGGGRNRQFSMPWHTVLPADIVHAVLYPYAELSAIKTRTRPTLVQIRGKCLRCGVVDVPLSYCTLTLCVLANPAYRLTHRSLGSKVLGFLGCSAVLNLRHSEAQELSTDYRTPVTLKKRKFLGLYLDPGCNTRSNPIGILDRCPIGQSYPPPFRGHRSRTTMHTRVSTLDIYPSRRKHK